MSILKVNQIRGKLFAMFEPLLDQSDIGAADRERVAMVPRLGCTGDLPRLVVPRKRRQEQFGMEQRKCAPCSAFLAQTSMPG
jgi:hypothetical protein